MTKHIRKIFQSNDHKVLMLYGLLIITIIVNLSFAVCAYTLHYPDVFWVKLGLTLIVGILLFLYMKYNHTSLVALLFLIILEIDHSFALFSKEFYNFIFVYPFFIIFGFFYFFRFKTAMWLTVAHFLYLTLLVLIRYKYIAAYSAWQTYLPNHNIFINSIIVVFLGIFYHFSTEIPYEKLQDDQRQKEMLLKEIHHRIKNNLNMIASIIGLQILNFKQGYSTNPEKILLDSKLRIESISMIHESLYHSKNLEYVDFSQYVTSLSALIGKTYNKKIDTKITSDVPAVHEKVMLHLGIILNELFTNSIKYDLSKENSPVEISLSDKGQTYLLRYYNRNNTDANIDQILQSKTLGIKLIQTTVRQLHGTLDVRQQDGLLFEIVFPKV